MALFYIIYYIDRLFEEEEFKISNIFLLFLKMLDRWEYF